ncbi:hypothetical protein ACO0LD_31180 [Undibacterium sp. Ji83W]|uniref:hypothetical protein n=1 Tax=Undibacterium sp. Ji83W TaxID=3413043 RepID=UPI003BF0806E
MTKDTATTLGFIFAPLIAAIIIALRSPNFGGQDFIAYGLVPIFYFFTFYTAILLGVPAFLLLDHFKLVNWWSIIGSGTVIGALAGIFIRLPSTPHLSDLLPTTPIGSASAFGFWLIWRMAR